ncbi:MAG: hypothetical protein ACREQY_06435 [Candidatus Binatia bacterium]
MARMKAPAAYLVAVDFSPASLRALDAALEWAPRAFASKRSPLAVSLP